MFYVLQGTCNKVFLMMYLKTVFLTHCLVKGTYLITDAHSC